MSAGAHRPAGGERPEPFGIASTARIAGHPIHPMLVPFPIAFLIGALLADLAVWNTRGPFWAVAGAWLVGAGVAGDALAALAGLPDFLGGRRLRALRAAWIHFLGSAATAILLAILNLYLRTATAPSAAEAVLPWGLAHSAAVVAILAVAGWLGWELVYRHGVGVAAVEGAERPR
jgi:uncharacterized membrane protein